MRALAFIFIGFGLIASHEEAKSQETCDRLHLTVSGRIENVGVTQDNRYFIEATTRECGEVGIQVRGALPRTCRVGATVTATGMLEEYLGAYDMENATRVSCY